MARLTVNEAAVEARRHPKTISEALRSGELHGTQRVKGGTWLIKSECLESWLDQVPCEHKANVIPITGRRSA
jgi:hypothetical protein